MRQRLLAPALVLGLAVLATPSVAETDESLADACAPPEPMAFESDYIDLHRAGGEPIVMTHPDGQLLWGSHAGSTHFYSPAAADETSAALSRTTRARPTSTCPTTVGSPGTSWDGSRSPAKRGPSPVSPTAASPTPSSPSTRPATSTSRRSTSPTSPSPSRATAAAATRCRTSLPSRCRTANGWRQTRRMCCGSWPTPSAADRPSLVNRSRAASTTGSTSPPMAGRPSLKARAWAASSPPTSRSTRPTGGSTNSTARATPSGCGSRWTRAPQTSPGVEFLNRDGTTTADTEEGGVDAPIIAHRYDRKSSIGPTFDIGSEGNLYVVWDDGGGAGRAPGMYYTYSTDRGLTWAEAVRLDDGTGTAFWPWIAAGSDGVVAVWLQNEENVAAHDPQAATAGWHVMASQSLTPTGCDTDSDGMIDTAPSFTTVQASDAPVHHGTICTGGTYCQAVAIDRRLGDYFANAIDRNGNAYVSVSDTREGGAVSLPLVIRQVGGSSSGDVYGGHPVFGAEQPTTEEPPSYGGFDGWMTALVG